MSNLITTLTGQNRFLAKYRTYLNTQIAASKIKVKLFKTNLVLSRNTVVADLTEADFDGYTSKTLAVAFGAVATNGDNRAEIVSGEVLTWTTTGTTHPNTIWGYWVYDTDDPVILWIEQVDTPGLDMTTTPKYINLTCRLTAKSEY